MLCLLCIISMLLNLAMRMFGCKRKKKDSFRFIVLEITSWKTDECFFCVHACVQFACSEHASMHACRRRKQASILQVTADKH